MSVATAVFHPGFGEKLRQARTTLGLTPADVAAKLKLGPRQIEALEAEDLAQLPGDVFTRGFVRNYARLVKIDPEQLIVPIDINAAIAETITAPSEGVSFASPGLRRWVLLPLLALSFFVLMVALLYYWLRQGEDALIAAPAESASTQTAPAESIMSVPIPAAATQESLAPADALPSAPAGMTTLATPPAAPSPAPAPTPLPPPAAAPATAVPAPMVQPRAASPGSPATAATTSVAAAVSRPPAPVAPAATAPAVATPVVPAAGNAHVLRFTPGLDAWIQVVDGKGKRYSRLVPAGSAETFAGEPPFRLVVGEAAQVKLTYDGHSIDLTPYIGQKVARLTLE